MLRFTIAGVARQALSSPERACAQSAQRRTIALFQSVRMSFKKAVMGEDRVERRLAANLGADVAGYRA